MAVVLVVVLLLTAIGGTLAYLTDTEEAVNTFTVGDVDIQLLESRFYTNNETKTPDEIRKDAATYPQYLAEVGNLVVPGDVFNKCIYVDNTGKNDAYYRVRMIVTRDQFNSFYFYENTSRLEESYFTKGIIAHYADGTTKDYSACCNAITGKTDFTNIKADTNWTKLEYIYTCTEILEAGKLAEYSPVYQFRMKKELDNEDLEGLKTNTDILVYADAIQAKGFADATAAFAAFDKQEGKPPVDGKPDSSDTEFVPSTVVSNLADLNAAFSNPEVSKVIMNGGIYTDPIDVPESKNLVVDDADIDTSDGYDICVSAGKNASITLNDGSFVAFEHTHVIDAQAEGSNVTVNGGTYEGNYLATVASNAKVTVNGGVFATASYPGTVLVMSTEDTNTSVVTITGGTFYSEAICDNPVKVNITGGTFYLTKGFTNYPAVPLYEYITISGGTFNIDPSAYLADGYTATQNAEDMWVVSAY